MPTTKVSAEASGQVRIALAAMSRDHERLMARAKVVPVNVYSSLAFKKNAIGRQRAVDKLIKIMPPPFIKYEHAWVWRTLRPRVSPLADHDSDGVEVAVLVAGRSRGDGVMTDASWGFFATWHSLGRLWERTGGQCDFRAAIIEAHDNLLAAPYETFAAARSGNKDWIIPAAGGGFPSDVRVVKDTLDDTTIFIRARTWMPAEMMAPNQLAMCRAILFRGDDTHPLGQGVLTPPQLRDIATPIDGICQLPLSIKQQLPREIGPKVKHQHASSTGG